MPYRAVKPRSDRGNIKDIQQAVIDHLGEDKNLPPTPFELRIKSLYEHAVIGHNQDLINSLGLIVMNGPTNNPVSIMRHREYVDSLKKKEINYIIPQLMFDLETMSTESLRAKYKQEKSLEAILGDYEFVKNATSGGSEHSIRSFRRVSE